MMRSAFLYPIPLILLSSPSVFLWLSPGTVFDLTEASKPAIWSALFHWIPFALLAATGLLALRFNQTRVTLLCALLAGVYRLLDTQPPPATVLVHIATLMLCVSYVLFFYLPEKGLLSLSGMGKVLFVVLQLGAVAHLASPRGGTVHESIEVVLARPEASSLLSWNPSVFPMAVFSLAAILVCLRKSPIHKALAAGCLASLAAALVGLHGIPGLWSLGNPRAALDLHIVSAAFLLLYAIYSLSWSRTYTDELTGQANRRALEEALDRLGRKYVVGMMDIDHFKKFNDRHGHRVGDEVLAFVASKLQAARIGRVYRYGGEEFVILCPGKNLESVEPLFEALRETVAGSRFVIRKQPRNPRTRGKKTEKKRQALSVTMSVGLASRNGSAATPRSVVEAADKALYKAKRAGRNRVAVASKHRKGK